MHPLILDLAFVIPDPDIAQVSNDQLSHPSFVESVYSAGRELVLDVSDLVV